MANEQRQNRRGAHQIDEITYAKGGLLLNGWESGAMNFETETLNKSILDFDKQLWYCTCLCEMFKLNYFRGSVQQFWKSYYKKLFFKIQFVKNLLVCVFGVFTFSFCYCFYEGFIHKIILVSRFLLFICISYPLKVFKFDARILRDSCAIHLLKTLSRLPKGIAFSVWFWFSCELAIIFHFAHL